VGLIYSPTELLAGHSISLVHNTNLRSITVDSGIFSGYAHVFPLPRHPPSASWALSLLSQITSPRLSKINLTIDACRLSALDRLNWSQLDEILTRPLWRDSLNRVVINVKLPDRRLLGARDLDWVRLRLPMITAIPSVLCRIKSKLASEGRR
jgi:hypothetical protein